VACLVLAAAAVGSSRGGGRAVLESKTAQHAASGAAAAKGEDWDGKIKMIEDGYAAKVAAEKKETQAKMKAEEAHMIKTMEEQRAAEEKAIHGFRMQEERRETVVLAQKKTYDIKQAEAKIRADEAKKVKVLEAKLSALHNLASRLGDDGDDEESLAKKGESAKKTKEELEEEKKREAAKAEEAKKKAEVAKEKAKQEALLAKEKAEEEAAKKKAEAEMAKAKAVAARKEREMKSQLSDEVKSLDEESKRVRSKMAAVEDALKQEPKIKKVDAFDVLVSKHGVKMPKCTETDCPVDHEHSSIVENPEMIHEVAKMAQNSNGKSKAKAMAFVKQLSEEIKNDYKSVMGFGNKSVKTAHEILKSGIKKKKAANLYQHDAYSESDADLGITDGY